MTAMRVYLGSDHAGFELKNEIIEHLTKNGHEPIDCGAYTYDAEDDYPAFCIAAALKTVGDNESLGIVIGGSGNGEQIAANKVPGARCALAWSVETASLAREHNKAQADRHRRRMHTVPEALAIVDAFLSTPWSEAERHHVVSTSWPSTRRRTSAEVPGAPAQGMPEGHTPTGRLHQRSSASAVIVSSPQGRFVDGAAAVNGEVLKKASAWGKHLFHHYEGGRVVHVHLGLYGTFSEVRGADAAAGGAGADADGRDGVRHRPARPTVCEVIDEADVDDVVARLGPDPLRRDADGSLAWARISKSRRPIGALLMDQTVIAGVGNVYRNELLFRHRIDPYRPGGHDQRRRVRRDVDRPGRADEGRAAARQDHHVYPEDDHGCRHTGRGVRGTYVSARGGAVSDLRTEVHRAARGAQSVLVPDLPDVEAAATDRLTRQSGAWN